MSLSSSDSPGRSRLSLSGSDHWYMWSGRTQMSELSGTLNGSARLQAAENKDSNGGQ
jgi:hypothetical protein